MWSREKLAELVEKRQHSQAQLPRAEEAILAYARWQGLTEEDNVDRAAAKTTLDEICDATEPEEWGRLKGLVGDVDDQIVKGLMRYALTRSLEQIREQRRDLDRLPDNSGPGQTRRRARSRSR